MLMWEKKTDDGSVHDTDNAYTFSTGAPWNPDGTMFSTFLNTLNGGATGIGGCVSYDGQTLTGGFAGHCDWRVPTILELQSMLLEPYPCATHPCVDPVFGPTQSTYYWSSTTFSGVPDGAFFLQLFDGRVSGSTKTYVTYVRAVRGRL